MASQFEHLGPRSWVEVDLGALRRNAAALARLAGVPLLPVVKADAYGCGAVQVARALESLDPWGFGVATVEEGRELRAAGITRPILLLSPVVDEELDQVARLALRPALGTPSAIRRFGPSGLPWHLAIETGMNRAGLRWDDVAACESLLRAHAPEGVFTHFHSAETDAASVALQEARFRHALDALPARPRLVHMSNTAGIAIAHTTLPVDLVRPGVGLYGATPGDGARVTFEPVVHVRARVVDFHPVPDGESVSYGARWHARGERRIATVACGYADGYRRCFGNRARALFRGRRVPVVGVVTMDLSMLDVTDVADLAERRAIGDVVTLIGRDGDDVITIDEAAAWGDTIGYEVLTNLALRMPRVHVERVA